MSITKALQDVRCTATISGIGSIEGRRAPSQFNQVTLDGICTTCAVVESRIPNPRRPLTPGPFAFLTISSDNVPAGTILGFLAWCE